MSADEDRRAVSPRKEADETGEDREAKEDRRKWWLIGLGVLAFGIVAAAALWLLRPQPEREQPPERPPFVATAAVEVREGPIEIVGQGTVRPRAEIGLSPEVAGRVVWVNPQLVSGGRVSRGETLVRIEAADFRNQVRQARAEIEQARVELERARQQRETAREQFARVRDRLRGGAEGRAGYDADFRSPGDEGAPSGSGALPVDPSPLALGEPQVQAARAALDAAVARFRNAQLALGRTSIEAPFSAFVRAEQVDVGQYVAPGQELARIYSADAVEVVVPLTQQKAALVPNLFAAGAGRGPPATVTTDYGGERFAWRGYVDRAQGAIDPATRTVDVVVRVPRPFERGRPVGPEGAGDPAAERPPLLVGFFTEVAIQGRSPGRYVEIPRDALRDGNRAWLVRDGRIRFVPVQVIAEREGRVLARAPALSEGDRVVIGELDEVSEGLRVRTRIDGAAPGAGARRAGGAGTRYDEDGGR